MWVFIVVWTAGAIASMSLVESLFYPGKPEPSSDVMWAVFALWAVFAGIAEAFWYRVNRDRGGA